MVGAHGLHVLEKGDGADGPLVVLLHGSMDRAASMARVARGLAGHHVVRYDRRGYGRSRTTTEPADLGRHADDLLEVIADRPAVVLGHSYGGVVALVAAERRPDLVVGVVAYEAPMPWRAWWPDRTASATSASLGPDTGDAAESFLRRMLGDERWEAMPEGVRTDRRAEGAALVADMDSVRRPDPPYDPMALTVPLVAVRGTRSADHLMRAAEVLADEVAGARLRIVDGASHGGHLTHPDEVAAIVADVVDRFRRG